MAHDNELNHPSAGRAGFNVFMKHIKLHPVRTNKWRNHWFEWPRSKQVVASMLLWASRAQATQIVFDPSLEIPLTYSNAVDDQIETELPAPPDEVVEKFLIYLQAIATDDSWFGLVRAKREFDTDSELEVAIAVPDIELHVTHNWVMRVGGTSATFTSTDDLL